MGVSGNSNAGKSFQSFAVSEELLAKVVEAVKAGEKKARSSGDIQSFEVFYRGFRQNISIGRLYVIPASVCNSKGDKKFPTSLLYGCLVKVFGNGEEVGDMVEQRIGDTEFDEYSQADYDTIKEKLFQDADGESKSLILFAPMWWNKREYITFHYTDDQGKLSNNVRHQVFAAYYDPRLSSAFNAIQTNVNTTLVDVTDITPKIPFPFLAENMLKQYPDLQKQGSSKKRLALTFKTADEVTKEVLDPQELNVFDSLDQALSEAIMPHTETVDEAGKASDGGFNSPDPSNEVPRVANAADPIDPKKAPKKPMPRPGEVARNDGNGNWIPENQYPKQKGSSLEPAAFETPFTNVGPGTEAHAAQKNMVPAVKESMEKVEGEAPIGIELDETGVPKPKEASADAFTPVSKKDKVHPGNLKDADVIAAIDEKKWGTATIPLNFGPRKGGVPTVKSAAQKADIIADAIAYDYIQPYEAMSRKSKQARDENEAKLNRSRSKQADVATDIDSIWAEITEDFGPAPVVDVPSSAPSEGGGGSSESKPEGSSDGRPRKSDMGKLPESFTSDKPEEEKAMSDSEAESQEDSTPKPESHEDGESKESSDEVWRADSKTADFLDHLDDFANNPSPAALRAAQDAIDNDDEVIYDVAANTGQIVDNVKHMTWFVEAVARELDNQETDNMVDNINRFELGGEGDKEAAAPAGALDLDVPQGVPNESWQCQNCGNEGQLGMDGNCESCGSQSVYPMMAAPSAHKAPGSMREKTNMAAKKKADTADNPYNMAGGDGAPEDKKDVRVKDTSGPTPVNTKQASLIQLLIKAHELVNEMYPGKEPKDLTPEEKEIVGKELNKRLKQDIKSDPKTGNEVQPDVAEAKSEVVSPDTVDADIQQPTESVEEAAKSAAFQIAAAFVRTATITVKQGENGQMIIDMNGQEYVLRGPDADAFRHEYSAIQKPEAKINMLVEKYLGKMKKHDQNYQTPTERKQFERKDRENYNKGLGAPVALGMSAAAPEKTSADVSGDMSEAKSELDHGAKAELADNSEATQTESVAEAAKVAAAGDDMSEEVPFDFGAGDLADIVMTEEDGDGATE